MSSVEKKTFATEAAEVMEPNNAKVDIFRICSSCSSKFASVDLPEPDRPVNHISAEL